VDVVAGPGVRSFSGGEGGAKQQEDTGTNI
jgi:hypothetical protein